MDTAILPPLPKVKAEDAKNLEAPTLKIRTDTDVESWKSTEGYQNYLLFLHRLSEAVVGHVLPERIDGTTEMSSLDRRDPSFAYPAEIRKSRFSAMGKETGGCGLSHHASNLNNYAYEAIFQNANDLLKCLLPPCFHCCIRLLKPYFIISFGSFGRMDYGTGHEAAFGLFLLCLSLIRFFDPSPAEERDLVLFVFYRYLRLCWRLQDVYRLEPAGSHGVWGLDDYSFLGYIFGSAQLREDQKDIPVSAILRPPLPRTNLYFVSISRIHEFKRGPFHEHSSQLYAIATGVPNWAKVHSGLFKMYEAEVLGKRVVVQHIPVEGLLGWDPVMHPYAAAPTGTSENCVRPAANGAPWTSSSAVGNFLSHDPPTTPWASMHVPSNISAPLSTRAPWPNSGPPADRSS
ncbi:Phosphotyrosyl phosphatase activator [Sanghuangporus baumii]|uniref:Serine/threonine-protein phosphatase 2A activator n=1 Tax=Sanghuangporus baumii TaxID=108892 RepID=A0A9Q5N4Z9_SANBA|nr:Phosphotyrosyl phosphatase activator [Sanghuangporus baumii]